jgi:hypothetical protein
MHEIRTILRIAARRLQLTSLLAHAHVAVIVLAAVVLLLLAVERAGPAPFWPWPWLLPLLAAAGALVAGRRWYARRPSEQLVALEVDERLDLRERLSTALHCQRRTDPFARAAVEDAVGAARDPKVREQLRRRFAVQSPPRWWLSPLAVVAAVALSFVPALDLFAREVPPDPALNQTVRERDDAIEAVIKPIAESPQLQEELSDLLGALSNEGPDPESLKTRQEVQRDAIKKLTDLNKRLDEILSGPKGKTAEALDKALQRLRTPEEGPAKELAEALARGDFKAAQEALAQLREEARHGDLTPEQQAQLAEQLADIARQLEQLAQQQQQLEQLLEQAGLDPKLAQNLEALQQAMQDNPNLNQQQQQQLMQMAQAQQAAGQMCQGLGQGLNQMAQEMMMGQPGPGGQQAADQLNQMEALQQMLQQARAAANACQGQCQGLGQGLAMQQAMQWWLQRGGAFGQRGQGAGGEAPIAPTPTGRNIVKAPTKTGQGDIIARQFIDGPNVVGESRAELRQVSVAVSEGFDERPPKRTKRAQRNDVRGGVGTSAAGRGRPRHVSSLPVRGAWPRVGWHGHLGRRTRPSVSCQKLARGERAQSPFRTGQQVGPCHPGGSGLHCSGSWIRGLRRLGAGRRCLRLRRRPRRPGGDAGVRAPDRDPGRRRRRHRADQDDRAGQPPPRRAQPPAGRCVLVLGGIQHDQPRRGGRAGRLRAGRRARMARGVS